MWACGLFQCLTHHAVLCCVCLCLQVQAPHILDQVLSGKQYCSCMYAAMEGCLLGSQKCMDRSRWCKAILQSCTQHGAAVGSIFGLSSGSPVCQLHWVGFGLFWVCELIITPCFEGEVARLCVESL
jgi:hypothetical protein